MAKRIHIVGIAGTFMAGLAIIAKQNGFQVTGHDKECYSPMREQLANNGIDVLLGYDNDDLPVADCYVLGNSVSRGNPILEQILIRGLPYTSGPEWLADNVLAGKWVVAVAGTHGKTTTSSIVTWILEKSGYNPGFLVGGVVENLGVSARLTDSEVFVIEADEYDTAFYDKRPKFMHYRPKTLILNNLEYDHSDIYSSLSDIARQFSLLVKTVPSNGLIIYPNDDNALCDLIENGCWSKRQAFFNSHSKSGWSVYGDSNYSQFCIGFSGRDIASVNWNLQGQHNAANACAALIAANHVGVPGPVASKALATFSGVKRRLELKGNFAGITCYEDFGHHPTAIMKVLSCLKVTMAPEQRLFALVELGSYTIRNGVMAGQLQKSLAIANHSWVSIATNLNCDYNWDNWADGIPNVNVAKDYNILADTIVSQAKPGDVFVCFSSRSVSEIHDIIKGKLLPAFA